MKQIILKMENTTHANTTHRCEKPLTAQPRSLQMSLHQNKRSNDSKDGDKTAQHTPNTASAAHDVVVNRCEKPLTAWPRGLQMSPHQKKGLRPFKSRGKRQRVFHNPCSIAVNEKSGYIVVAEGLSHRVQLFDSE